MAPTVRQAERAKLERRQAFAGGLEWDSTMHRKLQRFDADEQTFFRQHAPTVLQGYVRREFTIGGAVQMADVAQALADFPRTHGLAHCAAYHFSDFGPCALYCRPCSIGVGPHRFTARALSSDALSVALSARAAKGVLPALPPPPMLPLPPITGHSATMRFFPDGKAWLGAGCERSDLDFVAALAAAAVPDDSAPPPPGPLLALLTRHRASSGLPAGARYHRLPAQFVPPRFLQRNGYQVVGYRKYGDFGRAFNGPCQPCMALS